MVGRGAKSESRKKLRWNTMREREKAPGGVLPYKSHVCMCRPKG